MRNLVYLTVILLALGSERVRSQPVEELVQGCWDRANPRRVIEVCTTIIQSGRDVGNPLADILNNRANAYADVADYPRAITDYSEALRLRPNYPQFYANRGQTYADQGDYIRALRDHDEAIRLDPQYSAAYLNRAIVHTELNNLDRALADFNEAIRSNPDARAYSSRGALFSQQGEHARALADFNEAIRLDSQFAPAYRNRAGTYAVLRDTQRARADFREAVRLQPEYARDRIRFCQLFIEAGVSAADASEACSLD